MFGYNLFPKEVKDVFDENSLKTYEFVIVKEDKFSVVFKSKRCSLIISIDGLIIEGTFPEPRFTFLDDEYYPFGSLMEFKNRNFEILDFKPDFSNVIEKLIVLKNKIEANCLDILIHGDFSWKKDFEHFLDKRFKERNQILLFLYLLLSY